MAKHQAVPRQSFLAKWASAPPAWLCVGGLVLLTLAVYVPVWQAGFIWDDDAHVTKNPKLRNVAGLRQIWFNHDATPQYYPLVHTTFWLEYQMWGLHPLGYHLTNLLLHACNAVLLWLVLRRLGVPGAFWAALLFAVHPVHVESVAWITERKNVLSGLCYLGSFLAWLRFWPPEEDRPRFAGRWPFYVLVLLLFLGAMLSKTVTCSLPAVFLLVRWWKQGRVSIRDLLVTAPLFALGLPLALHTAFLEKYHVGALGQEWNWSFVERGLIAGRAVCFYAGKLFWPAPLAFSYPRWQIDAASWWQIGLPVAVVSALVVLFGLRRRLGRGPLVAALFFVGTLLPALGFFNVYPMRYTFVADHFQYLASIGMLVLIGAGIDWCLRRRTAPVRYASGTALGLTVAVFGALTWQQARVYHDACTLWSDTLAKNPDSLMAYSNRAQAYQDSGQWQLAIEDCTRALEMKPDTANWYATRGSCRYQLRQLDDAIRDDTRAIELEPGLATAYANRGLAFQASGQVQWAINDYTQAIALAPELASTYVDRGTIYSEQGEVQRAIGDYSRAIELADQQVNVCVGLLAQPALANAYVDRGTAYWQLGDLQHAVSDYSRAIELAPDLVSAYSNRGLLYQQLGQVQQALADCSRAIELKPDFAAAYSNRGMAYQQMGQASQAIADYSRAIELKPKYVKAYCNRAIVEQQQGQTQQALADCTRVTELQPDMAYAYGIRGTIFLQMGRVDQAISDYSHVIYLEPLSAEGYCGRATAYRQAGQYEQAIEDCSQVLALKPNCAPVYFERAFLYYHTRQYEAAWGDIRRGQSLGGRPSPELLNVLKGTPGG